MNNLTCNTEKANIMVLMLKRILEKNLQEVVIYEKIKNLDSVIFLKAGKMSCVLKISYGKISLLDEINGKYDAKVEGSLKDFLGIALGKYPVISFFKKKLKISGNPLALLPLLSLFKV